MAECVPESTALFLEIDNLSNVLTSLVKTEAWQKMAPQLGISDQLKYLGSTADFFATTGLGPEEAVLLTRAQYAVMMDGLEAQSEAAQNSQGQELVLKPRLTILIETHASPQKVETLIMPRLALLARRFYGGDLSSSAEDYQGIKITNYRAKSEERNLVVAQSGSIAIVGNQVDGVKSCLNVLIGKAARLSNNAEFQYARGQLNSEGAMVWAYVPGKSLARFWQLGGLLWTGKAADPNTSQIVDALSSQVITGLVYNAALDNQRIKESYYTLIRSDLNDELRKSLIATTDKDLLNSLPSNSYDLILFRIEKPAVALEKFITAISARTNVVVGFALKQLMIDLDKKYGIAAQSPIGELLGNEIGLIKLSANDSKALLGISVRNKVGLLPALGQYLRTEGKMVQSEQYHGVEIVIGSNERAATFIGNVLFVGATDQLKFLIDTKVEQNSLLSELAQKDSPIMISCRANQRDTAQTILAVSRILRVTDGSVELLEKEQVKQVWANLAPSLSKVLLAESGIKIETDSALGPFTWANTFLADTQNELRETEFQKGN